jgi:hypothetical protein
MKQTILLSFGLAITCWAATPSVRGQVVREGAYYNPYTGTSAAARKTYNPYNGRATEAAARDNAYTGRDVHTKEAYNPVTGNAYKAQSVTNPYTGRSTYHYAYRR